MAITPAQAAAGWTMDHRLHVLIQTEARDGEPDDKGVRWVHRQTTGKAVAVCSCGFTSGLVDTDSLPPVVELVRAHPPFVMNEQLIGLLG